jgi:hypothetical protein
VEDIEGNASVRRLDDPDMFPAQFPGVPATTGMGDHVDLAVQAANIVRDALGLVLDDQAPL